MLGWEEDRTPAVCVFLLEAWPGGHAFLGVLLQVTQQVLKLGKLPPVLPWRDGEDGWSPSMLLDLTLPRALCLPGGGGPQTEAVTLALTAVSMGLALYHPGGASRARSLLHLVPLGVETDATQTCSTDGFCRCLDPPCSRWALMPGDGQGATAHLLEDM